MEIDAPTRMHGRWGFAQQELIAGVPLWRPYVVSPSNARLHIPRPDLFDNPEMALLEVASYGNRIHRKGNR